MNKILFKIFGATSQEMFREISKSFGINPLEGEYYTAEE